MQRYRGPGAERDHRGPGASPDRHRVGIGAGADVADRNRGTNVATSILGPVNINTLWSTFGGALVSTIATLLGSAAGAGAGVAVVSTTGSVRVSNLRSGAFGMSRFNVVFSVCCGVFERNIGTKMIASAISTAAPSRRCFKAESIGISPRELRQLYLHGSGYAVK